MDMSPGMSADSTALLDALPAALLLVDPGAQTVWANAAASALAPGAGPAAWLAWLAGARPLLDGGATSLALPLPGPAPLAAAASAASSASAEEASARWAQVQARPWPEGGWALSLQAIDSQRAAEAEVRHLQELLDLARDFGRLGLWERDARTLEGHWDRQVQMFRGLGSDSVTPNFEAGLEQVALADRESLNRVFRESLRQAGAYSHRFSLRTADGTLRRVHSQWRVKAGADGRPERAVGLLVDDTETLALAGVSGELESQLALAVDLGRIAIWRHDLRTQRMQYNAQAWAVLDIPARPEGLSIDDVRALIHPDDVPAVMASAQLAMKSERPVDVEARYRRSDGSWRQVLTRRVLQRDASGAAIAFVGVSMDVTERRDAELALRNAAERVALVTRSAGLGTWEVDLRDGTAFWDEQMWVLRGHKPQPRAMTPEERMALVHPEDRDRVLALHQASMAAQLPAEYEFRIVWPDGQVRWLATRSQTLLDERGQPVRRIGVNWDVTAARTAAAMRQEREIAQRESAAKSQFMARVSHELRTPLNAVLGFTELMLADTALALVHEPAAASRQRRLQHVQAAGQHLLALINDVLDLAGLESGELRVALEPVSLAAVLETSLPMLDPLLQARQVRLTSSLDQEPPVMVLADATRLRQVLLNLLSNAIKYNRAGGRVEVRALRQGDAVQLSVSDTGRGMSPEQLRHLFEPFNRLGAEGSDIEGSGIGLTIARTLAERMGGRLEVHSVAGQGSRFVLHLQAWQAAAASGTPAAIGTAAAGTAGMVAGPGAGIAAGPPSGIGVAAKPEAARPAGAGLHQVLYIEDNPVNALIIAELLARRRDIALHLAVDGTSGLARARELQPALLLLDMQLPDINGLEVLQRLRADPATAAIPCMALSANAMPDDIERALRAGAADYWTKPLDFRAFMAALDALFGPQPG